MTHSDLRLKLFAATCEKVPKGYLTSAQWQRHWGISITETKSLLRQAVAAKLFTAKKFKVMAGSWPRLTTHYKEL